MKLEDDHSQKQKKALWWETLLSYLCTTSSSRSSWASDTSSTAIPHLHLDVLYRLKLNKYKAKLTAVNPSVLLFLALPQWLCPCFIQRNYP